MDDLDDGTRVDASNAEYAGPENDEIQEEAGREQLSFAGMMFWIFATFLALLGVCVLIAIILALVKGT